jgi:hypothetical protein
MMWGKAKSKLSPGMAGLSLMMVDGEPERRRRRCSGLDVKEKRA